jgi:hypothetical protein
MNKTNKNWGRCSKECFAFWKTNKRGLTPLPVDGCSSDCSTGLRL